MVFFEEPWKGSRIRDILSTAMATHRAEIRTSVEDYHAGLLPTIQSHTTLSIPIGAQRHIHQRYRLRTTVSSETSDVQ